MWKLHRYYLRELASTTAITFVVMFSIVMCASLYQGIERAQGADLLAAMVATMFYVADTLQHLVTISLLAATVLVFARASADREITAVRAGGISPRVPMMSAMLIGIFLSVLGSYAYHYVLPWAHYHKYRVVGEALRSFISHSGVSGHRLVYGGFFMAWRNRDDDGTFHEVTIKMRSPRAGLEGGKAYVADQARIDLIGEGDLLDLSLDGLRRVAGGRYLGHISFGVPLRDLGDKGRRAEGDKDLTTDQLMGEVMRGWHPNPNGARFTVQQRSCFAIMPALFAPIGFCIGVLARDRGRMTAILLGLIPLLLFYGLTLLAPTVVQATDWPPVAWLPAAGVAVLGAPFCWRLLRL